MIITVDPGNVSGVAVYSGPGTIPQSFEVPYADFSRFFWGQLEQVILPEVVVERYVMTSSKLLTPQPLALMTMGQVEMACHRHGLGWHYYLASVNKANCPDSLLRKLGWYRRTKDGHANDGMRLIITHLKTRRPEEFAALVGL